VSTSSYHLSVEIKGGNGGDGLMSFSRMANKPKCGPDGGDGGKGGDVYVEASENFYSLEHLRNTPNLKAEDGETGGKNKKHGRNGRDLIIYVPVGTAVYEKDGQKLLADLIETKQKVKVAGGGGGGKGNINFATSSNQAPRISTPGKEGETKTLRLVFNPEANIVVIGPPNSGKSSLIAHITGRKLDIADYPFTTKKPHLWTHIHNFSRYTFMDTLPMVSETLEEIEILTRRAKILLVVFDGTNSESLEKLQSMMEDIEERFNKDRSRKIGIVLTKTDKAKKPPDISVPYPVFFVSAETGKGMDKLKDFLFEKVSM
jgi:GTP-binding protein